MIRKHNNVSLRRFWGLRTQTAKLQHHDIPNVSLPTPVLQTLALRDRGAKLFLHPLDAAHEQVRMPELFGGILTLG